MSTNTLKANLNRFEQIFQVTPAKARWLALGAVIGPILFNLAWFVLGFISPGFTIFGTRIEPYSPVSQPLSGLGLGPTAPFMNGAFVLGGILIIGGVSGIFLRMREMIVATTRWTSIALLSLSGLGLIVDGIYTLEHFMPHMLGYLLGTAPPVVGFLIAGRAFLRIPRWRRLGSGLLLASPLTLVLLVLSLATFDQAASAAGLGIAGLVQRILVLELHAWFVAMGWKAFRQP